MNVDDGGVLDWVARSVARTGEGLSHWNRLRMGGTLAGHLRWPSVTRLSEPAATRVNVAEPARIRHHYTVRSWPADGYAMKIEPATFDAYDESDPGVGLREVRLACFKKPGDFVPTLRRAALDRILREKRARGELVEGTSGPDGGYRLEGVGFGEVVLAAEAPFWFLPHRRRTTSGASTRGACFGAWCSCSRETAR